MLGKCCVKSWSSTQALIALSSGEAEYYGVVKASSVGLGLKALFADLGIDIRVEILTDASAAKGIAGRRGLGKTRHIAVHYLWIQERVANGDIVVSKVWGGENPADTLTKYIDRKLLTKHMSTFGVEYLEGRAAGAPTVACLTRAEAVSLHQRAVGRGGS